MAALMVESNREHKESRPTSLMEELSCEAGKLPLTSLTGRFPHRLQGCRAVASMVESHQELEGSRPINLPMESPHELEGLHLTGLIEEVPSLRSMRARAGEGNQPMVGRPMTPTRT